MVVKRKKPKAAPTAAPQTLPAPPPAAPHPEAKTKRPNPIESRFLKFARKYVETYNATEAYQHAHPDVKRTTAGVEGSRLLKDPRVQAMIQRLEEQAARAAERYNATPERITRELALLGFSNMLDYVTISEDGEPHLDLSVLTPDQAAAIKSFDFEKGKFQLYDKGQALERLAKIVGLYSDQPIASVPVNFHVHWAMGPPPREIED